MAEAGEERPQNVKRGPHLADQVVGRFGPDHIRGVNRDGGLIDPVGLGAERVEQVDHDLRITDSREVAESYDAFGEEGSRHDSDGGVLAAARSHPPRQSLSTLDDYLVQSDMILCLNGPARGGIDRLRAIIMA